MKRKKKEAQATADSFGSTRSEPSRMPVWSAMAPLIAKKIKTEPLGANR